MKCIAVATVSFLCKLSCDDEKMVREYARENDVSFGTAIWDLYSQGEINIYDNHYEVDCDTMSIENVEE